MLFPYIVVNSLGHVVAGFVSHQAALAFKYNGQPGEYTIQQQSIVQATK